MTRRLFLTGTIASVPYLYLSRVSLAVRRYRVPVRRLPDSFDGFTILLLTDLHEKQFGEGGSDLIDLVSRESFDMVAFTGDMVVGGNPSITPAVELATGIRKVSGRPIYSVCGNHEWALNRGAEFTGRLQEAGVQVLSNRSTWIERGKDRLWIIGVDDPVTGRDRLELALSGTKSDFPRLLLAHSPHPFPEAVKNRLDLMLAGHTHAGQLRIPFLGAAYVPSMGFFPRWDYGLYQTGDTTMIVSGGLGETMLPVRVNIRPEVCLVTLEPSREPARYQPETAESKL